MQRTSYSKGRVSQLLGEGFGERAAAEIANRLGLRDKRWFDRPLGTPVGALPRDLDESHRPKGLVAPEVVTRVTQIPKPFNQALFDALPVEQQQDIARIAALVVDAFTRYNAPPRGKATAWPKRQHDSDLTSKTLKGVPPKKRESGNQ